MASGASYIVAGSRLWNRRVFDEVICKYPGQWQFVGAPEELDLDRVRAINPHYIFFLHWSWKVPNEIIMEYECVCFHMTDVPYGRGGSPLQNLILEGHRQTKLTALKMVEELDAGPVYLKENLFIGSGSAEEIYTQATYKAAEMIRHIIAGGIEPVPQEGNPTVFKRRRPADSEMPKLESLQQLYDFIRMLDAEGYPRAFIEAKGFRLQFSGASLQNGQVTAKVTIRKVDEGERGKL